MLQDVYTHLELAENNVSAASVIVERMIADDVLLGSHKDDLYQAYALLSTPGVRLSKRILMKIATSLGIGLKSRA